MHSFTFLPFTSSSLIIFVLFYHIFISTSFIFMYYICIGFYRFDWALLSAAQCIILISSINALCLLILNLCCDFNIIYNIITSWKSQGIIKISYFKIILKIWKWETFWTIYINFIVSKYFILFSNRFASGKCCILQIKFSFYYTLLCSFCFFYFHYYYLLSSYILWS